jgi:hypothetical protein
MGDADAVGQTERATQDRVIALFCDELGYRLVDGPCPTCQNTISGVWNQPRGHSPNTTSGTQRTLVSSAKGGLHGWYVLTRSRGINHTVCRGKVEWADTGEVFAVLRNHRKLLLSTRKRCTICLNFKNGWSG